jgi:hypothetical protein
VKRYFRHDVGLIWIRNSTMTNRDPYDTRGVNDGWSAGAIAAAIIAVVIVIGAIAYGISNNSQTASNPSPSPPSTVGQGGGPQAPTGGSPQTPARPSGNTQ